MRSLTFWSVLCAVACLFSFSVFAEDAEIAALGRLRFTLPTGWQVAQIADSGDTRIVNLRKGDDSITLYHRPTTGLRMSDFATSDVKMTQAETKTKYAMLNWSRMGTSKTATKGTAYVSHFLFENKGSSYYGFSRASSASAAQQNADALLSAAELVSLAPTSLTTAGAGKKFYLGWGAAMSGDPSSMHNEVKYDVLHTQNIFAAQWGGDYSPEQWVGAGTATASNIKKSWDKIKKEIGPNDMFLQYSSGHGSESGLEVGISYRQIRDNALSYPAKEMVIFIMACHSGGLVDLFDDVKSQWSDFDSQGRSLFVMASSDVNTNSEGGPGKDKDEPGGPTGSAGSAFGHALWKSLIGPADGFVDGVKDGFISLAEIRDYATFRTRQIANHTPVHTGSYFPHIIMNRVPTKSYLASLTGGTENLSDAQIEDAVRRLNEEMAVQNVR